MSKYVFSVFVFIIAKRIFPEKPKTTMKMCHNQYIDKFMSAFRSQIYVPKHATPGKLDYKQKITFVLIHSINPCEEKVGY